MALNEILLEVCKIKNLDDIRVQLCNSIEMWAKGCILPLSKKSNFGITKNYRRISRTAIAIKVYNSMLLNRIQPEPKKILWKIQSGFQRNRFRNTDSDYPPNRWRIACKIARGITIVCSISFHTQRKHRANTACMWYLQRKYYSSNDALQKH